jgi:hypothetical protein
VAKILPSTYGSLPYPACQTAALRVRPARYEVPPTKTQILGANGLAAGLSENYKPDPYIGSGVGLEPLAAPSLTHLTPRPCRRHIRGKYSDTVLVCMEQCNKISASCSHTVACLIAVSCVYSSETSNHLVLRVSVEMVEYMTLIHAWQICI